MKANKYKTKPVIIEAVEWKGNNPFEICEFIDEGKIVSMKEGKDYFYIRTLEGDMRVDKGDFIIKGLRGEFYSCKPDVFEKKYELYQDLTFTRMLEKANLSEVKDE